MLIKVKESTKLKELSYWGISTDPKKDIQLKSELDINTEF